MKRNKSIVTTTIKNLAQQKLGHFDTEGTLKMFVFVFALLFVINYAIVVEPSRVNKAGNLINERVRVEPFLKKMKTEHWIVRYFIELMITFLRECGVDQELVERFQNRFTDIEDKLAFAFSVASLVLAFVSIVLFCYKPRSAKRGVSQTDLVLNLRGRINILEKQCEQYAAENTSLQDELNEAKKKQLYSDDAAWSAQENLQKMTKKIGQNEDQRSQIKEAIEEHSTLIEKLNHQLIHQLDQNFNEGNRNEAVVQDLKRQILSLQEKLEAKDSEITEVKKKLCETTMKNASLERQIKIQSAEEDAIRLREDKKQRSAEKELENLRIKYDELNNMANGLQGQFRSQLASAEQKCHENWLQMRSKERELDEVKRERDWVKRRLELERQQSMKNTSPPLGNYIPYPPVLRVRSVKDPPCATRPGHRSYGPFFVPPGVPPPPICHGSPYKMKDSYKRENKNYKGAEQPTGPSQEIPASKNSLSDPVSPPTPSSLRQQPDTGLRSCYYL